ncbi:hypothetical protein EDM53_02330 [Rickettsiales endosymbiont of Peranema trichophorum]|uniref:rod shape-determining protein MreD n=1 Tax=Rickettsiales endosymbiont of Peranema trichophorum TaxID=2486577 RepID=UPI001022E8DD|nr:hypothetical protein EDM53_02330 [Rickettsiales endosymbiont of Peranema trichophorum]
MYTLIIKTLLHLFLLTLITFSHTPTLSPQNVLLPDIILLFIFFGELFQVSRLSKICLFIFGVFNDYINNTVIGITPLEFAIITTIISVNYKALNNQKFVIIWLTFICAATIVYIIKFVVISIFYTSFTYNMYELSKLLLTISSYPMIHLLFFQILKNQVLIKNNEK